MSIYVAAYDISHPGRRRRVARELKRYGRRIQRSVFVVHLEAPELPTLRRRVGPLLGRHDDFDLFPVDTRDPKRRLRWQRPPEIWQPVRLI